MTKSVSQMKKDYEEAQNNLREGFVADLRNTSSKNKRLMDSVDRQIAKVMSVFNAILAKLHARRENAEALRRAANDELVRLNESRTEEKV